MIAIALKRRAVAYAQVWSIHSNSLLSTVRETYGISKHTFVILDQRGYGKARYCTADST